MKFKNYLIAVFFTVIWIANNIGYISLHNKVSKLNDFISINFLLDTYVGILMITYLFIFYSYGTKSTVNYSYLIRLGNTKYILKLVKDNFICVLEYTAIYTIISCFGNLIFASKTLVCSTNFVKFILFQSMSLIVYLVFVSVVGILMWVVCAFKKASMWLTAIEMTVLCYLPLGIFSLMNIFEGTSIIENNSMSKSSLLNILVYILFEIVLLFISIIIFKKKDVISEVKYER